MVALPLPRSTIDSQFFRHALPHRSARTVHHSMTAPKSTIVTRSRLAAEVFKLMKEKGFLLVVDIADALWRCATST